MKTVHIDSYLKYADGTNITPCVVKAIEELKANGGGTLVFDKKTYFFKESGSVKHVCNVSNNSHGEKSVIFPIINASDITIDGGGATFLFSGGIFPVAGDGAKNVTVQNFNIAYDRPFHTEGLVVANNDDEDYFDIAIDEKKYPVHIRGDRFIAYSENYEAHPDIGFLVTEFDIKRKAMAIGHDYFCLRSGKPDENSDEFFKNNYFIPERLENGNIRIHMPNRTQPYVGSVMTFQNEGRMNCGLFFNRCENVTLRNINIFECAGMGVVMQRTRNILLDKVDIRLRREDEEGYDADRCVSITADATHFVHCMGSFEMKDCELMNMLDDGTNIHGVYTLFEKRLASDKLLVNYPNNNIAAYNEGEAVYFVEQSIMKRTFEAVITNVEFVDYKHDILTFDRPLPEYIGKGFAIENHTAMPESVHLHGCKTGNNRPRGFLITTRGKVLIENNTFCNPSCGIEMAADANFWYESGPADDVEIRNNKFIACGHLWNGNAIEIVPSVPGGEEKFHDKVCIHHNEFISGHKAVLGAHRVKHLSYYDNVYTHTDEYPSYGERALVTVENCNIDKMSY